MAAGDLYFAWVGGAVDPAFTLQTTGDLWSGSLSTAVDLWNGTLVTSIDLVKGETAATIADTTSLRSGKTYTIKETSGLADGTTFVYGGTNDITLSAAPTISGSGVSTKITNDGEKLIAVNLENRDGLRVGTEYQIAGQGITFGTTFTYEGGTEITLSQVPDETTQGASVTITSSADLDLVVNLGSEAGLIAGDLYSIVGVGVPANATFTFGGSPGSVRMYVNATENVTGSVLTISKGPTEDDGGAFDAATMAVEDEDIFNIEIEHQEGEYAVARVDLVNPKVGLLRSSRKRWCWLSWDDGTGVKPLFHGRLVGLPQQVQANVVQLEFIARPNDLAYQKAVLAAGMRDLPYFDRVWMTPDKWDDPDAVLETRAASWHTDRLTLAVTTSSNIAGEDGTIELIDNMHYYDAVEISYGQPPLRQVAVVATATWTQAAEGDVDLTGKLVDAFITAGSPYQSPNVGSFTSDGLLSSWPQPGTSFGGGWSVSADAITVSAAAWMQTISYLLSYSAKDPADDPNAIKISATLVENSTEITNISTNSVDLAALTYDVAGTGIPEAPDQNHPITLIVSSDLSSGTLSEAATQTGDYISLSLLPHHYATSYSSLTTGFSNYDVLFNQTPLNVHFPVHYIAARARSETVTFALLADTQLLLSDAEGSDIDSIVLSSDLVAQTVEPDGTMPIGNPSRNSYFPSDRGGLSIQFLLLLAAAKMWDRARAVNLKCEGELIDLQDITCRKNILLHDDRLPGGQASGKVKSYLMKIAGAGSRTVEVVIGCMIGKGNTLATASAGTDTYADGYADGYTQRTGAQIDIIAGDLQYASLDGTYVIDDDGVDFANMTPDRIISRLVITNGSTDQQAAADAAALVTGTGKPVDAVNARPTKVELELVPVIGGAFRTNYAVIPSKLSIPQTINLEA